MEFDLNFPRIFPEPSISATFRSKPEDFIVEEQLDCEFTGEGEHEYFWIKKVNANTAWVAERLAKFFGVKTMDVGFSGMKDRVAETYQWFSIYLPKKKDVTQEALNEFLAPDAQVLRHERHSSKLRRGQHQKNHFKIYLRQLSADPSLLEQRLTDIKQFGVPNYFGEQRFGRNANNLHRAQHWIDSDKTQPARQQKGIILSSARSYLFNCVLAHRVKQNVWSEVLAGDVSEDIPTAPLWGRGTSRVNLDTLALESDALSPWQAWCEKLEHCGLKQERRDAVLLPENLTWSGEGDSLCLAFSLNTGQFATALLRELVGLVNASQVNVSNHSSN